MGTGAVAVSDPRACGRSRRAAVRCGAVRCDLRALGTEALAAMRSMPPAKAREKKLLPRCACARVRAR